jgi:hypothetical protein
MLALGDIGQSPRADDLEGLISEMSISNEACLVPPIVLCVTDQVNSDPLVI